MHVYVVFAHPSKRSFTWEVPDFLSDGAPKWNLPDPMPDTCQY